MDIDANGLFESALSTVNGQMGGLNSLMEEINISLKSSFWKDNIENYIMNLSLELFKCAEVVEKIGAHETISKINYKKKYNDCYMNPNIDKAKPTVAELTIYAEENSLTEQCANEAFSKAYKIAKGKIEAAEQMLLSLRILYSNMSEETNYKTKKILNE